MKKLIGMVMVSMLWGCGGSEQQAQTETADLAQQGAELSGSDPMVGLWAWDNNSDFTVQIDSSGTGRIQNYSCNPGCFPNGSVYFQNVAPSYYGSNYTLYSGKVFSTGTSDNCQNYYYTGARYTLSSDGRHMKVEWLDGGRVTGYS